MLETHTDTARLFHPIVHQTITIRGLACTLTRQLPAETSAPIGEPLQFPPLFDRRFGAAFCPCLNGNGKWYLEGQVAEVSFRRARLMRLVEKDQRHRKEPITPIGRPRPQRTGSTTQRPSQSLRNQLQPVYHQQRLSPVLPSAQVQFQPYGTVKRVNRQEVLVASSPACAVHGLGSTGFALLVEGGMCCSHSLLH